MPHNGGRAQVNVDLNVEQYFFPTNIVVSDACSWSLVNTSTQQGYAGEHSAYVDQATWGMLPLAGHEWWTNQLRVFGVNGSKWVLTWTGQCDPEFTIADDYNYGLYNPARANRVPALEGVNRRVFELSGIYPVTLADVNAGPPTNGSFQWANKTGEFGYSILCRIKIKSHVGPVRVKLYRLSDEADVMAGKIYTPEVVTTFAGMGAVRFMDAMGGGHLPGATERSQFAPAGFPYLGATHLYRPPCYVGDATEISENYFDVPTRSDKPTASDRMALQFTLPYALKWKRCQVAPTGSSGVPAGKTRLTWANHGFNNGDYIVRIQNYWQQGGDTRNGVADNGGYTRITGSDFSRIEATTRYRDAWQVTVIDANTIDITFDSSTSGLIVGDYITFMKPPRIRYAGQTFYMQMADGRWWMDDTSSPFVGSRNMAGAFVVPVGRTIADAHFITGTGAGTRHRPFEHFVDLCNTWGSHCWLTMYGFMSDECITAVATEVKNRLAPGLEAWFELGNEYWQPPSWAYAGTLFYTWVANAGTKPNGEYYGVRTQLAYGAAKSLYSHYSRNMIKLAKAAFVGSGKTARGVIAGQAAYNATSAHTVNLVGLENYGVGDAPGDVADFYAVAPYVVGPSFGLEGTPIASGWGSVSGWTLSSDHWYVRTTGGPPGYTKGSLQAFVEGDRTTAFNIARDSRLATQNMGYWAPGQEKDKWLQACQPYPQIKIVMYEGGLEYWKVDARSFGFTAAQISEWWWHWRRSTQFADLVRQVYGNWFAMGDKFLWPSWFILVNAWSAPRVDGPGYAGMNWSLAHFNTPEGVSYTEGYYAYMNEVNNPGGLLTSGSFFVTARPANLTYTPAQVQPYYAMTKWNCFTRDLGLGVHNFTSHTFKVALSLSTPQASWTRLSDVPQIGTTGGYVTGGYAVTVTWTETAGIGVLKIDDKEITATSDGLSFRYAVFYNDTAANDPLIGFYDFGPVTMQETDVLNINFDEAQGALRVQ